MSTPFATVKGWVVAAADRDAAYLLVVWDTFDERDYPIICADADEARAHIAEFDRDDHADRLVEVYDLSMDLDEQLAAARADNRPPHKPSVR